MKITINTTTYEFKYYPEYEGMDLYKNGKVVYSLAVSESQYEYFTLTDAARCIEQYLDSQGLDLDIASNYE